jgi:hypothetical protein
MRHLTKRQRSPDSTGRFTFVSFTPYFWGIISQRVAKHEYHQAELLGERVRPGVRSTLLR